MLDYKNSRLPSMPVVAQKILALNMDNERDQSALVPAICQCPVTAARIIAMANSGAYGVPGHTITSVKEAAQRIGLQKVYNSALASALFTMGKQSGKNRLNRDQLWAHNTDVIKVMRAIAGYAPPPIRPSEADIALTGLLHDIGFIVYDAIDPAGSENFYKGLKVNRDICELSMEIFGITHEELGAEILQTWGIPAPIVEAVRCHHETKQKHNSMLSRLVVAAEVLLQFSAFGNEKSKEMFEAEDLARMLGLKVEQVNLMVNDFKVKGLPVIL